MHNKYRWDKGFRVRVLGLVSFLLLLLVGLGWILSLTFTQLDQLHQQAERTRNSVQLMEQATGTFAEMTSALRGYLLTGQEPFLQPYTAATSRMEHILSQLKNTAADNPAQLTRIHQVSELVQSWKSQIAEPEIAAMRAQRPEAGSLVTTGSGLNYIEEIRSTGTTYIQYESDRLQQEVRSSTQAARNVQRITWTSVGVAGALALAGFGIFANTLTRATGALAAAAEAIGRGERRVMVEASLDGELGEVADAFTAMSVTLSAQEEELQAQQEELIAQNEELLAQQEELRDRATALERQDTILSRLNQVGDTLIGTIDMDKLSHQILDEYLDLFGGTAGLLLVHDPYSGQLTVQAERWIDPQWHKASLTPTGPLARCVELGQKVRSRYPETTTRIKIWGTDVPVVEELYLPLIHATRVMAVVVIASTEGLRPDEQVRSLVAGISQQSAVALTAALNHLEVKRTLSALQEQAAQVEELNSRLEEERDRAAAQLDIYLSIVSTMRAGAWLTDTGGNLLVVNSTFREFFGDLPEGAPFRAVLDQIAQQLPEGHPFPDTVTQMVESRDGSGEGRIRLENGYVLQWSSAPVGHAHDAVGRLFTFQDITKMDELDQLKSEFVSTVSHELRTPLTSIVGYLSLVLAEQVGKLQPQQREFLTIVSRNTERLANLINDLLDVQRIEAGRTPLQHKPVLLTDIVQHVAKTFRVAAQQKGLQFEVDPLPDPVPPIMGDPDRITQIASNLVSNAVKYTKEGSVTLSVTVKDGSISLTVADTGIGLTAADQKHLFERFFRGENKYAREAGGTGLGLPIVKMLVEEHDGSIDVDSKPGKGSRFTVTFPTI